MSVLFIEFNTETKETKPLAECDQARALYVRTALKNFMPESMPSPRKTHNKAVQVLEVDYSKDRRYMNDDNDDAQGLGERNKVFDSARAASKWIGCRNNEVAIALARARPDRPEGKPP